MTLLFSISLEGPKRVSVFSPLSDHDYMESEVADQGSLKASTTQDEGQDKPFTLSLLFIFGLGIYQDSVGLDF